MQIEVSLDIYKALTERLRYENQTYSDVIRELLNLDSPLELEGPAIGHRGLMTGWSSKEIAAVLGPGFHSRGLTLPNGTQLRARYKRKVYTAAIEANEWIDQEGKSQSSPSSAASSITGNNVNGLRFWEARRPGDSEWRRLDALS